MNPCSSVHLQFHPDHPSNETSWYWYFTVLKIGSYSNYFSRRLGHLGYLHMVLMPRPVDVYPLIIWLWCHNQERMTSTFWQVPNSVTILGMSIRISNAANCDEWDACIACIEATLYLGFKIYGDDFYLYIHMYQCIINLYSHQVQCIYINIWKKDYMIHDCITALLQILRTGHTFKCKSYWSNFLR